MAPFSGEHQQELVQADRLLRAADGSAEEREAAGAAYVASFFAQTIEHFRHEEEELFPLYARRAGRTALLERILAEHMQLHGLVCALRARVVAGEVEPALLRELGTLLQEHVRTEERELFELIQRTLRDDELRALAAR